MKRLIKWLIGKKCINCQGTGYVWIDIPNYQVEMPEFYIRFNGQYCCPVCRGKGRIYG